MSDEIRKVALALQGALAAACTNSKIVEVTVDPEAWIALRDSLKFDYIPTTSSWAQTPDSFAVAGVVFRPAQRRFA